MILTGKTHAPARGWARDGQPGGNPANSSWKRRGLHAGAYYSGAHYSVAMPDHWSGRLSDSVLMAGVVVLAAAALAAFAVAAPLILAGSALIGLVARNGAPTAWRPVRVRQRAH